MQYIAIYCNGSLILYNLYKIQMKAERCRIFFEHRTAHLPPRPWESSRKWPAAAGLRLGSVRAMPTLPFSLEASWGRILRKNMGYSDDRVPPDSLVNDQFQTTIWKYVPPTFTQTRLHKLGVGQPKYVDSINNYIYNQPKKSLIKQNRIFKVTE